MYRWYLCIDNSLSKRVWRIMRRNNNFRFYSILLEKPCLQFKLFGCFARLTTKRLTIVSEEPCHHRSLGWMESIQDWWNRFRSYVIVIALIRIERGNFKRDSHPFFDFRTSRPPPHSTNLCGPHATPVQSLDSANKWRRDETTVTREHVDNEWIV